jgi:hypothetical protein
MKRLLLATVALAALSLPAKADLISFLGPNPTSGGGNFGNADPGSVLLPAVTPANGGSGIASLGGAFVDIVNFSLTNPISLTIAFAVNTFAGGAPQQITSFTGAVVWEGADGQIGGGDDVVVIGPTPAAGCILIPQCQGFGGSADLAAGEYHLRITGNSGVDAAYAGNLSTFAVPGPIAGAGLPALLALSLLGFNYLRRRGSA